VGLVLHKLTGESVSECVSGGSDEGVRSIECLARSEERVSE
jgi:hypothetical protein